jgi:hypothetical protein
MTITPAPMQLSHAAALDIAGGAPAFRPSPDEDRALRDHLSGCPACARRVARMRTDLVAIGRVDPPVSPRLHDRIREAAVTAPRTGPSPLGVALVLGLLVLGVLGAAAGVGAWQSAQRDQPSSLGFNADDVVTWQTDVVTLAAREFWIDANGMRFTGVAPMGVHSDPGDEARWTLEVNWQEHDRLQRFYLYFKSDGSTWWVNGIRAYDGSNGVNAKDAEFGSGPWLKTPLGQAFSGTLDVTGTSDTGPVTIHLGGLRVAVTPHTSVRDPLPGASAGTVTLSEIACSGILGQAPAVVDGKLRALGWAVDWRWQYSTGTNTGQSDVLDTPPTEGYISGIAPGPPGVVVVFVEDPARPMMSPFAQSSRCPAAP